ncbi:hypothetical protein TKK_0009476 [Trichogramma kaykai]
MVPVKSKTGKDIAVAMESILSKEQRVPKHLHTDRGKEFYNKDFEAVMSKYGIHLYSIYSNLKASICDRFTRTLKTIMWKQFSLQGNHNIKRERRILLKSDDLSNSSPEKAGNRKEFKSLHSATAKTA